MNIDHFAYRHIGPRPEEIEIMLEKIGVKSLDELIEKTIPHEIRLKDDLPLQSGISESEYFRQIREIASHNKLFKTYIGMGYYGSMMPPVIQRNILENPSWYTSYTPYQAEISQGRLEALLNFQTVILEITGMQIANASLLDEGTAAAEAMMMLFNARTKEAADAKVFFIDINIFPQTFDVIKTRASVTGIEIVADDYKKLDSFKGVFGALIQYPAGDGMIRDYRSFVEYAHSRSITVAVAADIMSLVLLTPPGQFGADVVIGSTQRFGLPVNYGGPHSAYFATREIFKRHIPGRIIGVTIDRENRQALRMALQTREQHIKRERATSNICTSQALLASMAGMYAVYYGREGLQNIARRIHNQTEALCHTMLELGYHQSNKNFFDTLHIYPPEGVPTHNIKSIALERKVNFRYFADNSIGISMDETVNDEDLGLIVEIFAKAAGKASIKIAGIHSDHSGMDKSLLRTDNFMDLHLFKRYRSETEMMRYMKLLERKDFSLTHGMIPLGSCTMKLNAAIEMLPLSWPEFGNMHPFVPIDQAEGYHMIFKELREYLKIITGFEEISFQPNSGAAGEYAGLMVVRKYLESIQQSNRDIVLIPASAHGTNPASAVLAGLKVVVINCDEKGNIDMSDLKAKAELHRDNLAAFMVTYPSTHGVFEADIREMTGLIHLYGGQVYMDGANMNAQVGLTNPAAIGADVCHLNLHKTFAIPHGGGGPGAGPILVANHLKPFLPSHPVMKTSGDQGITAVASAPWGSAGILSISYGYCKLLGKEGLSYATKVAILNANYLAACLQEHYKVLYTGKNGFVGHEMILDCRHLKALANVTETDIAKRLMDYGFHAPTLSFPVHGTLMVEPTESESLFELDRFADAMKSIYQEIENIRDSENTEDNLLKNAPHTQQMSLADEWKHPYSRKQAVFPSTWCEQNKFWPAVSRVDDAYGDRNLVCSCLPLDLYR
jgi:glycine dehydrogenase